MTTELATTLGPELSDIFEGDQRVQVRPADLVLYRRFRSMECGLVSCLDGQTGENRQQPQILAVTLDDEPSGVLSFVVSTNSQKKSSANLYGRIDLVIMSANCRGLGLGRLLVLSALTQLLAVYGRRLYSLSCLAAHPAMEAILEQVGFSGVYRQGHHFKHEELRLEDQDSDQLLEDFIEKTQQALKVSCYKLKQMRRDN